MNANELREAIMVILIDLNDGPGSVDRAAMLTDKILALPIGTKTEKCSNPACVKGWIIGFNDGPAEHDSMGPVKCPTCNGTCQVSHPLTLADAIEEFLFTANTSESEVPDRQPQLESENEQLLRRVGELECENKKLIEDRDSLSITVQLMKWLAEVKK